MFGGIKVASQNTASTGVWEIEFEAEMAEQDAYERRAENRLSGKRKLNRP